MIGQLVWSIAAESSSEQERPRKPWKGKVIRADNGKFVVCPLPKTGVENLSTVAPQDLYHSVIAAWQAYRAEFEKYVATIKERAGELDEELIEADKTFGLLVRSEVAEALYENGFPDHTLPAALDLIEAIPAHSDIDVSPLLDDILRNAIKYKHEIDDFLETFEEDVQEVIRAEVVPRIHVLVEKILG